MRILIDRKLFLMLKYIKTAMINLNIGVFLANMIGFLTFSLFKIIFINKKIVEEDFTIEYMYYYPAIYTKLFKFITC